MLKVGKNIIKITIIIKFYSITILVNIIKLFYCIHILSLGPWDCWMNGKFKKKLFYFLHDTKDFVINYNYWNKFAI